MSKFRKWLKRVGESHARHVRLFHETQHAIIKNKIERDPDRMLARIRTMEGDLSELRSKLK